VPDAEHPPGPAESGDDLVGDQQDAVAIADLAYGGQVVVVGNADSGGVGDGLADERRDRLRAQRE
jgi:hypothetical protein